MPVSKYKLDAASDLGSWWCSAVERPGARVGCLTRCWVLKDRAGALRGADLTAFTQGLLLHSNR